MTITSGARACRLLITSAFVVVVIMLCLSCSRGPRGVATYQDALIQDGTNAEQLHFEWRRGYVPGRAFAFSAVRCVDIVDDDVFRIIELDFVEHVDLSFSRKVSDDAVQRIWSMPNLRSLSLFGCNQLSDLAFDGIERASSLTKLEVAYCVHITGNNWIPMFASKERSLELLDVSYCRRLEAMHLEALVSKLPVIKSFFALECPGVTDRVLIELSKAAAVVNINIDRAPSVTEHGIEALCDCETVEWMSLTGVAGVTDESLSGVSSLSRLHMLSLRDTSVTDQALGWLGELQALREVNLAFCEGVSQKGLCHFAQVSDLNTLWIGGTDAVGENEVAELRLALPSVSFLTIRQ